MTRYYNGGTQPLVPEGRWGEGVIMPGEAYETDAVLGPPWTVDAEADAALGQTQGDTSEAVSGPENASQGPAEDVPEGNISLSVHVEPNGDIVDQAGQMIGHEQPAATPEQAADAAQPTNGGNA